MGIREILSFVHFFVCDVYQFLYNLPFLLPTLVACTPYTVTVPPSLLDLLTFFLWLPLVTVDVALQAVILGYAIFHQGLLVSLYCALFVFFNAIGDLSKLEKTDKNNNKTVVTSTNTCNEHPKSEAIDEPSRRDTKIVESSYGQDESGYLSSTSCPDAEE